MLTELRHTVRTAWSTTPFYRDWFENCGFDPTGDFSFEDYARLPILERSHLRDAGWSLVSRDVPADQLQHDATGGSTGAPTEIWKGPAERGWGESGSEYFMGRIGLPSGSRIAFLWGHHLDPVRRTTLNERVHDWWFNVSWYDCFRLSPGTLRSYHAAMEKQRPAGVVAYASALAALGEFIARSGDRPAYPGRAFVTGAEKLFPHQRSVIERAFDRPVHERYGSRDAGLIGFQVDPFASLSFEVDWANKFVEPADGAGTTDILVTKLHADGMPLLRYRIGDIGRFTAESTPGSPALRIEEVVGRDVSRLVLPGGRWVHGLSVPHLMKDFPVREFQLVQREDLTVEVSVVPAEGYTQTTGEEIVGVIRQNVPGVPLSISVVAEIPRTAAGKLHPVVSRAARDISSPQG